LNHRLKKIIEELHVRIVFDAYLEKPAHYIAALNLVVVSSNLSEFETVKAVLHELGHASIHQGNHDLYNVTFAMHAKMEMQAEEFMTRCLIEDYVNAMDTDPRSINYVNFIKENKIDHNLEPKVKFWFMEYINGSVF